MSVILNATSSSGFGITADNSGIVQFQSVGANTVSINTSGQVTILSTTAGNALAVNSTVESILTVSGTSATTNGACAGLNYFGKKLGNAAVSTGQWTGYEYYLGWDGTAYRDMAYIAISPDATPANGTVPGRITFGVTPAGTNQFPVDVIRIDSDGNLALGNFNPTYKLDMVNASDAVARFRSNTTNAAYTLYQNSVSGTGATSGFYVGLAANATSANVWVYENAPLLFATNNTEQMRLDASGLVQINATTTYPNASSFLTINGNMASTYGITVRNNGATYGTTTRYVNFINSSNAVAGYIQQNAATTVVYTASSDARLKTNITDSPSTLTIIDNIRVRSYDWIDGGSHTQFGFVAQELHSYVPDAVYPGSDVDSNPWTIDYGRLTPFLMKAVQELKAENDALKARVEALENK